MEVFRVYDTNMDRIRLGGGGAGGLGGMLDILVLMD